VNGAASGIGRAIAEKLVEADMFRGRIDGKTNIARMINEFKEFISKGNVVMLAVGFIMGLAFQAVVSSLVEHVIMPIVAIPFGEPNFGELTFTVNDSVIMWGSFVTAAVVFLLTALAVFLFIVKPYNAYKDRYGQDQDEPEGGPSQIELLTEIRDSLRFRPI
jgi:large conductance mechanosensitive channel